jgi:hypothetical protein
MAGNPRNGSTTNTQNAGAAAEHVCVQHVGHIVVPADAAQEVLKYALISDPTIKPNVDRYIVCEGGPEGGGGDDRMSLYE